jgi:hypothetical protein
MIQRFVSVPVGAWQADDRRFRGWGSLGEIVLQDFCVVWRSVPVAR